MNKEKLWEIYTKRNPRFLSGDIAFTESGLKKFFEQTYDQGYKQGQKIARAAEAGIRGDVPGFLKGIFE